MTNYGPAALGGAVEFRQREFWYDLINAGVLIGKNSDLFGCLFGVTNYARFPPLFGGRGLPDDCSDKIALSYAKYQDELFGATWATYDELRSVDWTLESAEFDERIHVFRIEADGSERIVGKKLVDSLPDTVRSAIDRSGQYADGERVYRRCRAVRSDAKCHSDFDTLLDLMGVLAKRFGNQKVRLVVFFD